MCDMLAKEKAKRRKKLAGVENNISHDCPSCLAKSSCDTQTLRNTNAVSISATLSQPRESSQTAAALESLFSSFLAQLYFRFLLLIGFQTR